jgi:hypothetical protein
VHSGEAVERDGDFYGSAVNRAARLAAQAGSIGVCPAWFVVPDPPLVRRGLGVALAGQRNIARGLRWAARDPARAFALLGC